MRAAYAARRAEIGPLGYDDRIYRRKAMAKPRVHALTAEAEHLLTLRETHRLNGIPAVPFERRVPAASSISSAAVPAQARLRRSRLGGSSRSPPVDKPGRHRGG